MYIYIYIYIYSYIYIYIYLHIFTYITQFLQVVMDNMVKIYAWYDNECGYSMRTAELTRIVANRFVKNQ